jgi:hypothetical protein
MAQFECLQWGQRSDRQVMAEGVSSGNLLFAVVRQYCADSVRTAARAKHETIKGSKCTTAVDLKVGVGDTVRI